MKFRHIFLIIALVLIALTAWGMKATSDMTEEDARLYRMWIKLAWVGYDEPMR